MNLRLFLSTLVISSLISWSFLHIEPEHGFQTEIISSRVLTLKILESQATLDFLQNQSNFNQINHDKLNLDLQKQRVEKNRLLEAIQQLNSQDKQPEIEQAVDFYLNLAIQKENFLEVLKSESSVLANSLHYLQMDYANFQSLNFRPKLLQQFEYLLNQLILYNLNPNNVELRNAILTEIDAINLSESAQKNKNPTIPRFLTHSRILVENSAFLQSVIKELNRLDIEKSLDAIEKINAQIRTEEQKTAQQYQIFIGITTILMLVLIGVTLRRNKEAAQLLRHSLRELERQKFALDEHAIVSTTDISGNIIYVNQKFCEISGYTKEELIGKNHRLLNSDYHPTLFFAEMWETILAGHVWHAQVCNRNKAGNLYWVQSTIVPFLDENEQVEHFISMRTDITLQKQMEYDALNAEEWQKQILNNLGEGVYTLDSHGELTYLNAEAERILGWKFSEIKGKPIHPIIHYQKNDGSHLSADECPIFLSMQNNQIYRSDNEVFFHKNGTRIEISMVGAPLFDGNKLMGSVACFHDVSVEKHIKLQLVKAKESAEKASKLKSDFLSNMSHEIRTPMNGIIGMTDLLIDTELTEDQLEFTSIIKFSSEALLTIINDILDFSKIEAGQLKIEMIEFSVQSIVEGSADILANKAYEKSLSLMTFIDPAIPSKLFGDPMRLRQILLNFLSNAIKFTAQGSVLVSVTMLNKNNKIVWLRFEIKDEGMGISPEAQSRLFQPFSQADNSTTRKYGGTGLGLSISKRLADLMSGRIGLESKEGNGSIFWVELPFKVITSEVSFMLDKSIGKRILVVGKQTGHHEIYLTYLSAWGILVNTTNNTDEMFFILEEAIKLGEDYDAVLIVEFNEADMFSILNRMQQKSALKNLPIITCQDTKNENTKQDLLNHGVAHVLLKPVKQSALYDAIVEILHPEEFKQIKSVPITRRAIEVKTNHSHQQILLVEDNFVNQQVAKRLLTKLGYDVHIVNDGKEALDALEESVYTLILMDCQMPILDGFETTHLIRKKEETSKNVQHIPIIAMTANAIQGDREHCLAAGMDDYVSKPIDPKILENVLQKWMNPPDVFVKKNVINPIRHDDLKTVEDCAIEMKRINELFDGDVEMIDEILGLFNDSIPMLKQKLADSVNLKAVAHEIKGSSSNIGAVILGSIALKLENAVAEKDEANMAVFTAKMQHELDRVQQFIQNRK